MSINKIPGRFGAQDTRAPSADKVKRGAWGSDLAETYNSIKCLGMVQTSAKTDFKVASFQA